MMKYNYIQVSKLVSYILRHRPDKFSLALDDHGFLFCEDLIDVLQKRFPVFDANDLGTLIEHDKKGRFQMRGDKIRAAYGHSIEVLPVSTEVTPPSNLYHGTSQEVIEKIKTKGICSMNRQFVHLSVSQDDAKQVALRRTDNPIILEILALEAHQQGRVFYQESHIFLTAHVPLDFIVFPRCNILSPHI
ncbi:MAG: RNA 2'-phosphotransferase [Candidatus Omnitrophica bacterium]|nr:RNA 2'-phosphotransferase [Candidatus Omnitrophota bacterium]